MSRPLLLGLALAATLSLSACGGSNPELIPQDRADELTTTVDEIASRTSDADCEGADDALRSARNQVAELPRQVDDGLKDNLNEWLDQIGSRIEDDCKPEETPTPTPTETETPTETPTPEETETPTPTPTATETPPPEETVVPEDPTVEPPDTGGVDPGDGDG
jgi:outer membrane biosynthesis protein TonB